MDGTQFYMMFPALILSFLVSRVSFIFSDRQGISDREFFTYLCITILSILIFIYISGSAIYSSWYLYSINIRSQFMESVAQIALLSIISFIGFAFLWITFIFMEEGMSLGFGGEPVRRTSIVITSIFGLITFVFALLMFWSFQNAWALAAFYAWYIIVFLVWISIRFGVGWIVEGTRNPNRD